MPSTRSIKDGTNREDVEHSKLPGNPTGLNVRWHHGFGITISAVIGRREVMESLAARRTPLRRRPIRFVVRRRWRQSTF
nr:hypothetical protein [Lactiplantibacillus plantarum]